MRMTRTLYEWMISILHNKNIPIQNNIEYVIMETEGEVIGDYPIFDEAYRKPLNYKILAHFVNWQLGQETPALFKFTIDRKMREIMPYYNQLYLNALAVSGIDLTKDIDYYEKHEQKDTKEGNIQEESRGAGENENNTGVSHETNTQSSSDKKGNYSKNGDFSEESKGHKIGESTNSDSTNGTTNESRSTVDEDVFNNDTTSRTSDTPQGALTGINDNRYLTDVTITNQESTDKKNGTATLEGTANTVTNRNGTSNENSDSDKNGTNSENGNDAENVSSNELFTDNSNTYVKGDYTNQETGTKQETWNGTLDYLNHFYGIKNTPAILDQMLKAREAFLNIDMMVIEELKVCFSALW